MNGVATGLKILDFTWVGVGPITTKYLADNGAEVVKIESATRPDILRVAPPWKDAVPGLNRSQFFGSFNTSKKSVAINLGQPQGREIARRLASHFDIVADSFTAGTMDKMGLGYTDLSRDNPALIQLSTCMQGQTGPRAHFPGFGNLMASISGFYHLSGYGEDEIAPPYGAYTDFIAPKFACFALMSAIEYRRRTGQGQYIDLSQFEAALHFLAPVMTDYFASGTVMHAAGNRSRRFSPHGSYRGADEGDEERWIALSVENDEQWRSLVEVLTPDSPPEELATQFDRLQRFAAVDVYVQDLVRDHNTADLALRLQDAGVPAYPVQNCLDLRADDNLEQFGYWPWLDQTECGPMPYDGLDYRLDATPSQLSAAPNLGEHTEEVLGELLGMSSGQLEQLVTEHVLY